MTTFQMEALVDSLGLADVDLVALGGVVNEMLSRRGIGGGEPAHLHVCTEAEERIEELESALDEAADALKSIDRRRTPTPIKATR